MELSGICGFTQSAEHGFLVAEENNKILGYIGMCLSIDEGEITNVAVSPEMRCHGIGGMLAEAKRGREPLGRQNRA